MICFRFHFTGLQSIDQPWEKVERGAEYASADCSFAIGVFWRAHSTNLIGREERIS
jgi:hypothetical protein